MLTGKLDKQLNSVIASSIDHGFANSLAQHSGTQGRVAKASRGGAGQVGRPSPHLKKRYAAVMYCLVPQRLQHALPTVTPSLESPPQPFTR